MSPPGRRLTVLFTEGSSLSARHAVSALGPAGHALDLLDAQRFPLARLSRYVRAWYRCPRFAADPAAYLEFLEHRLRAGRYDVLLPVHEQVYLLARFQDRLGKLAGLAVPPFDALERVQDKAAFVRLLDELGLGGPATALVDDPTGLERWASFPCYVKLAYGTAGQGVWPIRDRNAMRRLARYLATSGRWTGSSPVLVQQPARGQFCTVQTVFQHGRLLAAHSCQALAVGVGGAAWAGVGVDHPEVRHDLARLGGHLRWHGALHLDYFYDPATRTAVYIDANPRLGETMNATLSGLNLCALLLRLSLGERLEPLPASTPGLRTHSLMMNLLALGQQHASRRRLVAEGWRAWAARGFYQGSQEELTPFREDPPSLLPLLVVALRLVLRPRTADAIVQGTVASYALSEAAARAIRELATKGEIAMRPSQPERCSTC